MNIGSSSRAARTRGSVTRVSKYNRPAPPPKRHIPVVVDGVTLENPINDYERVLGEGTGLQPERRGMLWGGIGAAVGTIPVVGGLSNLIGTAMANRGMEHRENPDGMPLVPGILAGAAMLSTLAGAAAVLSPGIGTITAAVGLGALSGGLTWGVAGYHGKNFA